MAFYPRGPSFHFQVEMDKFLNIFFALEYHFPCLACNCKRKPHRDRMPIKQIGQTLQSWGPMIARTVQPNGQRLRHPLILNQFRPRNSAQQSAYQGAWSSATDYSQNQSVLYAGAIYFSLINNNLANNPATTASAWSYRLRAEPRAHAGPRPSMGLVS